MGASYSLPGEGAFRLNRDTKAPEVAISSLKVATGFAVTLFEDINFSETQGRSLTIGPGTTATCLKSYRGLDFDDKTRAIAVWANRELHNSVY
jgi:hypothetical protein